MFKFYKINEQGYPETGVGKTIPEGYLEFTEVDGVYTPQELNDVIVAIKQAEEAERLAKETKEAKELSLNTLVVSANTVPFDADNQSINYMSSVIGLASFKMLQGMYNISDAKEIEELTEFDSLIISLYEATFKSRVEWKNANNTISNVQLETVAEALEKSMQEVSNIIVGAN